MEIGVPPEGVFAALTDPAELATWWGTGDSYRTYDWVSDLRVGGERSCKAHYQGSPEPLTVKGTYVEIDPPRALAFTWEPSWVPVHPTLVRFDLTAIPGGTRLVLTHSGWGEALPAREGHQNGWPRILGLLFAYFDK
jgi:uncharacterized protein YndB with AHSA1/START domain